MRVRRSSDNEETDIGALANGWVDKATLTAFMGTDDLFVTKLYAQSGSIDLTQTTAAAPPQIATDGTLAEDGDGLAPASLLFGLTASLNVADVFGSDGGVIILRMREDTGAFGRGFVELTEQLNFWATIGSTLYFDYGGQFGGRIYAAEPTGWRDEWHLIRCSRYVGDQEISIDGVSLVTGSRSATLPSSVQTFFTPYGAGHGVSEFVAWNNGSDAAAKETAMIV